MIQPSGPQLRDIHLPSAPSWWPPAPGWWMLTIVLLCLLGLAFWFARRQRRMARQRQKVMRELDRAALRYQQNGDFATLVGELHQLLRRVARDHDARAAQQRGDAWRRTLSRVPVNAAVLTQLVAMDQWLYRPPTEGDPAAAIAAVRSWLQLASRPKSWKALTEEHADA